MGATTGKGGMMDAARRRQATEGQSMRRRSIEQQSQSAPNEEQMVFPNMSTPQMSASPVAIPQPSMGRSPEIRSGINFGPGQANRIPEQGSPEYEQLLQRVRSLGQIQR
jgi:hypothetical protein